MTYSKWDIIYTSKFPETVNCTCSRNFTIEKYPCPYCGEPQRVSNIIAKIRPVLLWHDQTKWHESMTFAIPLSTSNNYLKDNFNHPILIDDYVYLFHNEKYHNPMRAVVSQSTRVDGNAFRKKNLIAKVTNTVTQNELETKLLNWIFC